MGNVVRGLNVRVRSWCSEPHSQSLGVQGFQGLSDPRKRPLWGPERDPPTPSRAEWATGDPGALGRGGPEPRGLQGGGLQRRGGFPKNAQPSPPAQSPAGGGHASQKWVAGLCWGGRLGWGVRPSWALESDPKPSKGCAVLGSGASKKEEG